MQYLENSNVQGMFSMLHQQQLCTLQHAHCGHVGNMQVHGHVSLLQGQ